MFSIRGRVGRAQYGLTVIFGALLLHNISRVMGSALVPNMRNGPYYLFPMSVVFRSEAMTSDMKRVLFLFALVAAPFLWLLITMTLKRLRDLETTEWFVFLLFVPAVNVLFFLLLCFQPSDEKLQETQRRGGTFLESLLPGTSWGSAVVGALAGAVGGTVLSYFSIAVVGNYGSTLFLGIPFFMGYLAAWLHGFRQPRTSGECLTVAMASIFLAGAFIVGIAFEGIICVAMAVPLAVPLALLGGALAHASQKSRHAQAQPAAMLSLLMVIPLLAGTEFWKPAPTPHHVVHSSITIAAPPEIVWQRVVAFPKIEEKPHWILRLGMAYPLESRTTGAGLNADRQTTFSTGISREPILSWEEGKHFAFRVGEEPPLMKESSPYGTIQVRHLQDHDFRPGRVDFYLTELPGGRTQLDCWSSYENRMWPGGYWQLWTDEIVRQIQLRVFRHIKKLAEADQRLSARN
jgi:uncharacterized membrane protein YhaH (DUF805 family)